MVISVTVPPILLVLFEYTLFVSEGTLTSVGCEEIPLAEALSWSTEDSTLKLGLARLGRPAARLPQRPAPVVLT